MDNVIAACVQPRMTILASREEFEASARRYLRQTLAKGAQLVVFPELTGVMLAPPLISQLKLGFIKRADQGNRPQAGFLSRSLGRFSGATASALGGGLTGSLKRLLSKKGDSLRDLYLETFGALAREFGSTLVGGSVYIYDTETDSIRNRAYVFDTDGTVLGYQDKFNLAPNEKQIADPGNDLAAIHTRAGNLGLLIGRDALYPELSRLLAIQGADLLVGLAAAACAAQADALRSALAMRVEENQVFCAASFLLGPNYLDEQAPEDYSGRSALLVPISLSERGDGILVQAGTNRTEGVIASVLDLTALYTLRETSGFRPRQEMHLGNLGPVLAELYRQGLTIEQAVEQHLAGPAAPLEEPLEYEPPPPPGAQPEEIGEPEPKPQPEPVSESVPEAMSLTRPSDVEQNLPG